MASLMLMNSLLLSFFIFIQCYRIAQNITANESYKRDACYKRAIDDEKHISTWTRLRNRLAGKVSADPIEDKPVSLDHTWGGLFTPDIILNTENCFTTENVHFNPYKQAKLWDNIKDALQLSQTKIAYHDKKIA